MGSFDDVAFIVLAAGFGTRMKSDKAKVLHELNGKAMIIHIMETLKLIVEKNIIVVVGYQADTVQNKITQNYRDIYFATQNIPKGTGDAVLTAIPLIDKKIRNIVVLCGDVPLVRANTLKKLIENHINQANDVTIQAVSMDNPHGYGRIVFDKSRQVTKIVEESDADENEKKITKINTGIYCVEKNFLIDSVKKIEPNNIKGEYYLTDIIQMAYRENKKIGAIVGKSPDEFIGVNSVEELQKAEERLLKHYNKNLDFKAYESL
jgi:bifunctional UDP-N-acetylglucosamine pyrophosphorylase/glucosamine-1-phosphate N-acetyltransferase/UDP-N-acetylglucosamine pyrophosphorylase